MSKFLREGHLSPQCLPTCAAHGSRLFGGVCDVAHDEWRWGTRAYVHVRSRHRTRVCNCAHVRRASDPRTRHGRHLCAFWPRLARARTRAAASMGELFLVLFLGTLYLYNVCSTCISLWKLTMHYKHYRSTDIIISCTGIVNKRIR